MRHWVSLLFVGLAILGVLSLIMICAYIVDQYCYKNTKFVEKVYNSLTKWEFHVNKKDVVGFNEADGSKCDFDDIGLNKIG